MTVPKNPAERRQRLIDIGTELYGPRFGNQLSKKLGVAQSLIAMIVTGDRNVTDDLELKLGGLCGLETLRLVRSIEKMEAWTRELIGEQTKEMAIEEEQEQDMEMGSGS